MSDLTDPDATAAHQPNPPTAPAGERFATGALLAGRYRIVAAVGKGGMGEVYRADDLTLGQSVALKFLPAELAHDPERLAQFHAEVRVARQVSHPHVCRIHDIGEADGQPFLTMEYIDGEDLAALLRRIGRLPEEKGIELARQLCQGLAAAHDRGVIHRDLKPANVMIDGRGQVRLTDFGLAAAGPVEDVRSGTPGYQAPEQLAGREVTARSDLFALGLVLYEVFTGRRAFTTTTAAELRRLYAEGSPSKPSNHVGGLDLAVERAILRCLEREPADRPRSAYEVLAALPGGDPLAAALAAGETPSPRMVADAGGEGAIPPWVGLALLGAILASIVLVALLADRVMLFRKVPLPEPPEVLTRRARQVLGHCGYADPPTDSAYHFRADVEVLRLIMRKDPSPGRWDNLAMVRPAPLYFFYRQSPRSFAAPIVITGVPLFISYLLVTDDNPPPTLPGMLGVHLDPSGRLVRLYAIPPQRSDAPPSPADLDWGRWFDSQTIGFDLNDLQPARPEWAPPCATDRQAAWSGTLPDRPDRPVRVEVAAYRGRPVYFEVMPADREADRPNRLPGGLGLPLALILLPGAVLLAIRNHHRGRGDMRGAVCLGAATLTVQIGAWVIGGHHSVSEEWGRLAVCLGVGGWLALVSGVGYLAIEPAIRRRWPWRITTWNRLLDGRLRDPMVGRDLLIGLAFGAAVLLVSRAERLAAAGAGVPPPPPLMGAGPGALQVPGPPTPPDVLLSYLLIPIVVPMMYLMVFFLSFLVLRREGPAWLAVWLFFVAQFMLPFLGPRPTENALTFFSQGLRVGLQVFALAASGYSPWRARCSVARCCRWCR
jgi:serine/threonine-protein kinase